MSSAQITIEQSGVRGAAGKSRDDLIVGDVVKLRNANDDGVTSWRWKLTAPKGSAATLSNVVAAAPEFTPDVPGTYVVELSVDQGATGQRDTRLAAVRNPAITTALFGDIETRFLGVKESDEANWVVDFGGAVGSKTNDTGYWEDLDRWFRLLLDVSISGGGGSGEPVINPEIPTGAGEINLRDFKGFSAIWDDGDNSPGSPALGVRFPQMEPGDIKAGRRVGVIALAGNPNSAISLQAFPGDQIFDGAAVTPVATIPAGTLSGYTALVWEAVPAGLPATGAEITSVTPDTDPGPFPTGSPTVLTINGTGGILPSLPDLSLALVGEFSPNPTVALVVTSAIQLAPGAGWQIVAELPAGLDGPGLYALTVFDLSTFSLYAASTGAFGAGVPSELSPARANVWIPVQTGSASGGGGGGGDAWDAVLLAGNTSNGTDAILTGDDKLVIAGVPGGGGGGRPVAPVRYRTGRQVNLSTFPVPPPVGFNQLGSPIVDAGASFGPQLASRAIVRAQCLTRQGDSAVAPGVMEWAVIEEVWAFNAPSPPTQLSVITAAGAVGAGGFRLGTDGVDLFVEVDYVSAAQDGIAVAHVDVTLLPGFTPV